MKQMNKFKALSALIMLESVGFDSETIEESYYELLESGDFASFYDLSIHEKHLLIIQAEKLIDDCELSRPYS